MSEIEIKFVTRQQAVDTFTRLVAPLLKEKGMTVSAPDVLDLQNDYYDTADAKFESAKMGFRVRGCNGRFEQTLKTRGRIQGGLHERAEYNVDISHSEPDLLLFDKGIWPKDWDISALDDALERQFSTHFTRTAYIVSWQQHEVEVVFDEGEVSTGKTASPIQEIELELKKGDVAALFTLAGLFNENLPLRLSDVSKAQQGYQLLHGLPAQIRPLPDYLELQEGISTEDAFARGVQTALAHWQLHEHLYLETGSIKMLNEVAVSLRLLLQCVSLYLPVLQCPPMLSLHKALLNYVQTWLWQDDLQSLRYLLSKKSLFAKRLYRHPAMVSYLQGRKAGILNAHDPESLFYDAGATRIKLAASALLVMKPWRQEAKGYDMPVMEHAKGWLSQGWQTVQQSMPGARKMGATNYTAVEMMLRQTLWSGFLLAELFDDRGQFRAPWLDLLTGIDELKALLMLNEAAKEAELESQHDLLTWSAEKMTSLLKVMERTREVAMSGDVYW